MDLLDSQAAWMTIGFVLLAAAAVGAGGNLLHFALPGVKSVPRQIVVAALGVVALVYGYQLENFRVTKVRLTAVPSTYSDTCPAKVTLTGTIRVAGGDGSVDYRFIRPAGEASPLRSARFDESGGKSVSETLRLSFERIGARPLTAIAQLKTYSPDTKESNPAPVSITCERPPRGVRLYRTDGYSALFPRRWKLALDDVQKTTYHRTKFVSPSGDYFVLIDWEPGQRRLRRPPRCAGQGCQSMGYRKLRIARRKVLRWRFVEAGKQRVDYMFIAQGDGYAVLAEGPDFPAADHQARQVLASIKPR